MAIKFKNARRVSHVITELWDPLGLKKYEYSKVVKAAKI